MSTVEQTQAETAAPAPATILLPDGCKPHKATGRDTTRPALCHGYLRQRDGDWWLLTTDSYIACALKVQVTGGVQEGWVPRSVLKLMAKEPQFIFRPEQISTTAWKVTTAEGHATIEIDAPSKEYVDLEGCGMWRATPGHPLTSIGLDPRLLLRLTKALGMPCRGVQLRFTTHKLKATGVSPIQVTGGAHFPDRIGLQMPIRMDTK